MRTASDQFTPLADETTVGCTAPTRLRTDLSQHVVTLGQHLAAFGASSAPPQRAADAPAASSIVAIGTTVDEVGTMIERALVASGLTSGTPLTAIATLTMKVIKTDAGGGKVGFSVCGIGGSAGAQRASKNTQPVVVSFGVAQTAVESEGAGPAASSEAAGGHALDASQLCHDLAKLKTALGANAVGWTNAVIDLDFTIDDTANLPVT